MIEPFRVNVPQEILDDLRGKISATRWPDELVDSGWSYGTNLAYLKELAAYWATDFDWRKVEDEINAYPNFIAVIDSVRIHFLHIKGKGKQTIPLLITHGWPGLFLEMMKLIPLLTQADDLSFDVVIPSVVGFGFSGTCSQPGCDSAFVAEVWHKLMSELGYKTYGAQGGDIGAGISTWLALKHPESVIGLHLNYIPGSYKPFLHENESMPEDVKAFQRSASDWSAREGAYAQQHSSKPLTLAYGLNDSPTGLCAWIVEKFYGWSDHQGNLETVFAKDDLLANVTLYWVTQTIHSSIRMYNENSKRPLLFREHDFVRVPVAFAKFPKELPTPPRAYIEKGYNIQRWTEMNTGGHFAAMEQPHLLARDIRAFFKGIG
ncbi:epoxide hydrolase [Spirosoma sp. KCTC 42546]|uniref:epoxide hydrolase family protein n=1 Tax=Spirosoma sp. KCTC 42546 TaxID=2520506 RepID=UPI001158F605|nr:epoxide hydrolase family protein [Spirosoma sp. KCTC 42546]QDK82353.1 epoxide hydrolase [Spirosoma sp. KCTC 42546]